MPTFGDAVRPFVEQARIPASDLLPVIPPEGKLSAASELPDTARGKTPGRQKPDGTWAGFNWIPGLTPAQFKRARSWETGNVGVRAARLPAVDIDTTSPEALRIVEEVAVACLGPAPFRERGGSHRGLMVYRLTGDVPVFKRALRFRMGGAEHGVDFLADGQQYLIAGTHPSGAPYLWREGAALADWTIDGLSTIEPADVEFFFRSLEVRLRGAGAEDIRLSVRGAAGADGTPFDALDPLVPAPLALAALRAVPNNDETLPTREGLIAVLAAFKAALGREAEDHREAVTEWACEHGWADPDYVAPIWESLTHARVSADYLFARARRAGWHSDAKADFAGLPVEDADREITAAQEAQEAIHEKLREVTQRLVYWGEEQRWIVLATGELLTTGAMNNHAIGRAVAPAGASGTKTASAILLNSGLCREVVGMTYRPGQPALFTQDWCGRSGLWYNRYRPGRLTPQGGDVKPFLEHIDWLFGADEAKQLVRWMAHIVQRPGRKIRWAPVIIGGQGIGKDLAFRPLSRIIGEQNYREIKPNRLLNAFTDWYESQVVVVQEMVRMEKIETYEHIKDLISGTGQDVLTVNKKYQSEYYIQNDFSMLFFTNNDDAFTISHDDRRFYVVRCLPEAPRDASYYDALADWYDTGGIEEVFAYLQGVDLKGFDAQRAPAWTDAKQEMLDASLPAASAWLVRQLGPKGMFADRTCLNLGHTQDAIMSNLQVPAKIREAFGRKAFTLALQAAGWHKRRYQVPLSDGTQARLWVKNPEQMALPEGKLRELFEAEEKPGREFAEA
jgi:hypothetical protein